MIYVIRNNQSFGPYDEQTLLSYVNDGRVLCQDKAYSQNNPINQNTVGYFLKQAGCKPKISNKGNIFQQIKTIGRELILPQTILKRKEWAKDKKMLMLALVGLAPAFLIRFLSLVPFLTYYSIALYFSLIWGLFFFYLFKTNQVKTKTAILVFFLTQAFVFVLWEILGLPHFPFISSVYALTDSSNILFRMLGFIFGVGFFEEMAKALPLLAICYQAKEPIIPQTLVFYGLMSGIAFGVFEGVGYQMSVNNALDYDNAFFMNVARLTSLPFLHAIWCGIAGYFIAFAKLYPKYRLSLYLLAIAVPSLLHGLYDTFGWGLIGLLVTFLGVVLLTNYLKKGVDYQSILSK
ncbi:hypothetical protein FACS1894199_13730 [Bacteroidia bacterium]|nr:hypothetical protein FACS1894199_13730 [Bacteroidia bacterium]